MAERGGVAGRPRGRGEGRNTLGAKGAAGHGAAGEPKGAGSVAVAAFETRGTERGLHVQA